MTECIFEGKTKIICFPPLLIYQCGSCKVTLYSSSLPVACLFSQGATCSCFSGSSEKTNYSCLYFRGQVTLREYRPSYMQATCMKAVLPLNSVACKYCLTCSCSSFIEKNIPCFTLASLKSESEEIKQMFSYIHIDTILSQMSALVFLLYIPLQTGE